MANEITIIFPDGSKKKFNKGITPQDIAKSISEGLARNALAAKINNTEFQNKIVDLSTPLESDTELKLLKFEDKEGQDVFRHSSAHLLAHAVTELFPYAKPTIGPVVDEGFYYDFEHEPFTPEDLEKIEKKMAEIAEQRLPIERIELKKSEALRLFKDNRYKIDMIDEMHPGEKITAYREGKFVDLCRGPHVSDTGKIRAFKLTKIAGAYWKGDAKNKQLQRIYGISFPDKKDLKKYLDFFEEAKKRDHRKIGKELDLFFFDQTSPGSPLFMPNGAVIYNELLKFIREEYRKRDYHEVITPQIFHKSLWETSGHWEHYKNDMFTFDIEGQTFSLKPMNCPSHILIYKKKLRSYRELPYRIADFCALHRNELTGVLAGLVRVRKFSQDDAHIFAAPEQIQDEIARLIEFTKYIYNKIFNFEFSVKLSTRPQSALGDESMWEKAEIALQEALKKNRIEYQIMKGEGAFYGPKIDFIIKDALGREWQLTTIQLDFNLPGRFDVTYEGKDGQRHRAVLIHRAILGSLERFIGILTEHYAGKFPLWLSPTQVIILTVADRHIEYGEKIYKKFFGAGVRVEKDFRAESIPKKVREAQLSQYNYILVVGDKEIEKGEVAVRTRDNVVRGAKKADEFLKEVLEEIGERK